ncbi:MAG: SAVED domain-containing protein [Candidatus Helarchaeota archaeon]
MIKEVKRHIKREVERLLWARAAGRCQFNGCNRILYKSPITQEKVNIAEKAHIYSLSEKGPRGWGPFYTNKNRLNELENLMLVCHDCHKTIDQDKEGDRYPANLLLKWKKQHEKRIEIVTGICPKKKSHFVLYGAKIGDENSPLQPAVAIEAMFPDWYPAEENPINLSMLCSHEDITEAYWHTEAKHLYSVFNRNIKPRIEESAPCHFSLFSLAPQPLLILLGTLLTDKIPVEVYQLHREPPTWKWQNHPDGFDFIINQPSDFEHIPVLIISLSDKINPDRVITVLDENISIWELTVKDCHNDFLKSQAQLSMFRETVRRLLVSIKKHHGNKHPLRIFPAMPVACAVEFGRVRMPKADIPFIIYDQNNKVGKFIEAIKIPGELNE